VAQGDSLEYCSPAREAQVRILHPPLFMKKTNVYIIFGGKSGEHEVSIKSARSVVSAINKDKYDVIPLGIAKNGTWLKGPEAQLALTARTKIDRGETTEVLPPTSTSRELTELVKNEESPPIVFPVLHGPYGEDGTIQGMLEMMNVPYVGAGVLGSALGMDKILQKQIFLHQGLPAVPFVWFLKKEWVKDKKGVLAKIKKLSTFPFFVKPANLGSSVGISKAHNEKELEKAIDVAGTYDRKIIIEKGMENIREIEVSVLGNDEPKASVCGEVIPANEFYDYDAKYIDGNSRLSIPAKISPSIQTKIQSIAIQAFQALDCCGFSRVDFFLEKKTNKIWLNELNTIPGFTSISMYPKLWEASGIPYSALIDKLIQLGIERWKEKQQLATSL
jgi:D-alanine-D-alanine ligase